MADTDAAKVTFNTAYASYFHVYPMTTGTEKVFGLGQPAGYGYIPLYAHWGAGDNGTTYSFYSSMGSLQQPIDWDDNSGGSTWQK